MSRPIVLPPANPQPLNSAQGIDPMLRSFQQPLPVRVSPNVNPYGRSPYQRAPVGATFNGIGAASVADAVRMQKDAYLASGDGLPITGPDYVQKIRMDAAGDLYVAPPSMPTAGYAAAFYNRPNEKMKVGAALAGTPFPGGTDPAWLRGSKYYIPQSPAEHRKAQMATLMGLGRIGTGVAAGETSDFTFNVPPEKLGEINGKYDPKLMNITWMSGDLGCRTDVDNQTGQNVLGLKPGKSSYASAEGIYKVKAAAVVQAMYEAGVPLTLTNLYTYGSLKAHDVGELINLMNQYPPGTAIPSNLRDDGSGTRSLFCRRSDLPLPSFEDACKATGQAIPGCPGYSTTPGGTTPVPDTGTPSNKTGSSDQSLTTETTDYMPVLIGVAAVAVIFLGYQAMKKQSAP